MLILPKARYLSVHWPWSNALCSNALKIRNLLSDVRNRSLAVMPPIGDVSRNRRHTIRLFAFSKIMEGTGHVIVMREMEVTWASDNTQCTPEAWQTPRTCVEVGRCVFEHRCVLELLLYWVSGLIYLVSVLIYWGSVLIYWVIGLLYWGSELV